MYFAQVITDGQKGQLPVHLHFTSQMELTKTLHPFHFTPGGFDHPFKFAVNLLAFIALNFRPYLLADRVTLGPSQRPFSRFTLDARLGKRARLTRRAFVNSLRRFVRDEIFYNPEQIGGLWTIKSIPMSCTAGWDLI